jgi:accessory gene regulator protein AgrB
MFKYIQKKYDFNSYQIAQLKFFFLTLISELSKIIILGIYFIDQYFLFIWCLLIFHLMRTTTGGIHCRNYISCLAVSFFFFFLCISVLANININKTTELILLLICTFIDYKIGPVISPIHMDLSIKSISNSKKDYYSLFFVIQ